MKPVSLKHIIDVYGNGLLNSYSQIFFSNSKVLAWLLIIISFFDIGAGLSGVLTILICQVTISMFNFNEAPVKDGYYTYNALMVGIALGMFYDFSGTFFILLLISSILTLFLTIWFDIALGRKRLPFLSIPFLLGIWIIILGAPNFTAFNLAQKQEISLMLWFPELFTSISDFISLLPLADAIHLYLRSLCAIFFQYNDLAGLIIAAGLLYFSRIAFGLSVFGFIIGYGFYYFFEGDFSELIYSYIGFNFILTSIALGGFFVVPSRRSYLNLLLTIPIIALLISAFHTLFSYFGLPLYSLPFNLVTLLFLAAMATRYKTSGIDLVTIQQFSPEKHHYKHLNYKNRFKNDTYFHIALPFLGDWRISQGHAGDITHKGEWQHAWDFDVVDEEGSTYRPAGSNVKDYFCYELPVVAPSAGYVTKIMDHVDDNPIGEVNLKDNWGNTIIINHGEHFYSKLSHIRKGSFKVKEGEYVKKGQVLALCGSSGRSPEPHLHFQLQATPYIDSKTLSYPIAYYLTKEENGHQFHTFGIPKKDDIVSNVKTSNLLTNAFGFIPGKTLTFEYGGKRVKWEVFTNSLNQPYIYCHATKSTAYFVNDGTSFYFTDFYGKNSSLLHHFYYGAQRVLLGYYDNIQLKDQLVIEGFFNKLMTGIHDFTAPFFHYLHVRYQFDFESCDNLHKPGKIVFRSRCTGKIGNKTFKELDYTFVLENDKIASFRVNNDKTAVCVS